MIAARQIAYCGSKRKPYDAEIEYLESTGTQYIDTGVIPDTQDVRVEITYANGTGHLFGSRYSSSFSAANNLWSAYAKSSNVCQTDWIGVNTSISVTPSAKTIVFLSDATGSSITYNDTTKTGGIKTPINLPLILFGVNTNGAISVATKMTLYSFKAWKNGILVFDAIPVRKGDIGYMYDKVSGKLFGNAGEGAFVLGKDLVDGIPLTWVDGECYDRSGKISKNVAYSRIDNYIPVIGGHSITWKYSDKIHPYAYLILYDAEKQFFDYYSPNSNTGERTVTIPANTCFVRYSVDPLFKDATFLRDNTTGFVIVHDGEIDVNFPT